MTVNEPSGTDAATIVRSLLDAAKLTVSDDEFDGFVRMYPTMRQNADAMYVPEMEPEAPAMHFDPAVGYS
jgi:hypothetical protein